jgi:hypothetical protein
MAGLGTNLKSLNFLVGGRVILGKKKIKASRRPRAAPISIYFFFIFFSKKAPLEYLWVFFWGLLRVEKGDLGGIWIGLGFVSHMPLPLKKPISKEDILGFDAGRGQNRSQIWFVFVHLGFSTPKGENGKGQMDDKTKRIWGRF